MKTTTEKKTKTKKNDEREGEETEKKNSLLLLFIWTSYQIWIPNTNSHISANPLKLTSL